MQSVLDLSFAVPASAPLFMLLSAALQFSIKMFAQKTTPPPFPPLETAVSQTALAQGHLHTERARQRSDKRNPQQILQNIFNS